MDPIYAELAARAVTALESLPTPPASSRPPRLLIALAGPPGAGKTTTAQCVANMINSVVLPPAASDPLGPPTAAVVSLDGFHLPRSALAAMPDPELAFARRGAPWTFDGEAVVQCIERARDADKELRAPGFDHAIKDPVPDEQLVRAGTRIVVFEGNYVLADAEPWAGAARAVDQRWFLDVRPGVARRRLAARHLAAGIVGTMADGEAMVEGNDAPNGEWIREHLVEVDVRVESVEEGGHEG